MTDLEKFIAKCDQNAKPDNEINLKDFPELTEEDFARGHFKYQTRLNEVLRWAKMNDCPLDDLEDIYLSEKVLTDIRSGKEKTYSADEVYKDLFVLNHTHPNIANSVESQHIRTKN